MAQKGDDEQRGDGHEAPQGQIGPPPEPEGIGDQEDTKAEDEVDESVEEHRVVEQKRQDHAEPRSFSSSCFRQQVPAEEIEQRRDCQKEPSSLERRQPESHERNRKEVECQIGNWPPVHDVELLHRRVAPVMREDLDARLVVRQVDERQVLDQEERGDLDRSDNGHDRPVETGRHSWLDRGVGIGSA